MSGMRQEGDGPRSGSAGYFSAERIRAEQDAAPRRKPATLGTRIVQMSLRGDTQDVERLVAKMRAEGIPVWRANSKGTRDGNQAGYSYFSVEVPRDPGE